VTLIELLIVVAMIGTLAAIGYPIYGTALQKAKVAKAIADIRVLSTEIGTYQLFDGGSPLSLADIGRATFKDPYGNPYEYLNFCIKKDKKGKCKKPKARKDRFLVPLNSDYDLYSKGQDGKSKAPLTAKASRDDIIRAVDGGYIGLASEF
jgi:general secretion pathway protein G